MKTCRICLATEVKFVKISSTKIKDFIEGIFDQNGFRQSVGLHHYSCLECKALLYKTYNFIQKTLRAQNALYDILKKNNNKVTMKLLKGIDRDRLGLSSQLRYKKIDVDLELIHDNSELALNSFDIETKNFKLEHIGTAIIDEDPITDVLKIHEDEVIIKTEELPDPLSNNVIVTVHTNEANNLNICDDNYDDTNIESDIRYEYTDDKLCDDESDRHSDSVTDVDHLCIKKALSLQSENEYSGRKRRRKQIAYKVDKKLSDESIEKPSKAKAKNDDDEDFEPIGSGESTDCMMETHGENRKHVVRSGCRVYPMKCDDMAPENRTKQKKGRDKLGGISKKTTRRRLFTYSEDNLNKALQEIKSKTMGIREACRFYGVPKTTVQDRLSGKVAANKMPKVGPDPVLGREGEVKLKNWVLNMGRRGFSINKKDLLESVSKIIRDSRIKNPFKDGTPGPSWYQSFLRRHPEVRIRDPEGINNATAAVTEKRIRLWFKDLKDYMKSIDALDIFDDPNRIFNCDQTVFSLCPESDKVLGPRGYKNQDIKKNNEKHNITVFVVFSASGKICPPLVIFPYVSSPKVLIYKMSESCVLGQSENGWMRSDLFYEYISNSFNTWLTKNNIKKPILIFTDRGKSHMNLSLSQFCEANGIIFYALPSNTTHMLQPADVSIFTPLNQEWKKTVRNWQALDDNINQTVTTINFCKILNETLTTIDLEEAIINEFRKCGLYPLNEDSLDYTKCVRNTQRKVRVSNSNSKQTVTAKDYDTAMKVISLIQEQISKYNIDTKVTLAEIDKAKENLLANHHPKSMTPQPSAGSIQSTSIFDEEVLIDANTAKTPDNLSFFEPEFAIP